MPHSVSRPINLRHLYDVAIDLVHRWVGKGSGQDTRFLKSGRGDVIWEVEVAGDAITAPDRNGQDEPAAAMDLEAWLHDVHPKDRLRAMASLRSALEGGGTEWCHEYRRRRPGRGYVHVSDHAYIMRGEDWRPVRVVARSTDRDEMECRPPGVESEGPYRAFFENNPEAILLADSSWRIVKANDAACDLFGYGRAELTRLNLEDLFEDRKRGAVMHRLLGLDPDDQSSLAFEEQCLEADGDVFWARITAAVISQLESGVIDRMITIEEVTE